MLCCVVLCCVVLCCVVLCCVVLCCVVLCCVVLCCVVLCCVVLCCVVLCCVVLCCVVLCCVVVAEAHISSMAYHSYAVKESYANQPVTQTIDPGPGLYSNASCNPAQLLDADPDHHPLPGVTWRSAWGPRPPSPNLRPWETAPPPLNSEPSNICESC